MSRLLRRLRRETLPPDARDAVCIRRRLLPGDRAAAEVRRQRRLELIGDTRQVVRPGDDVAATGVDLVRQLPGQGLGAEFVLGVRLLAQFLAELAPVGQVGLGDARPMVAHRDDDPANPIRVINLSYGTDGVQDFQVDPLTHAVQNAWRAGIVVVVSGGNAGFGSPKLNNPAYDPHVIAVGAADTRDTAWPSDDTVPDFSSRGDAARRVDVVAPGRSRARCRP